MDLDGGNERIWKCQIERHQNDRQLNRVVNRDRDEKDSSKAMAAAATGAAATPIGLHL